MCDLKSSEGQAPTLSQKLVREYVRKLLVNSNILKFRRAKKDKDKIQEICGRYRRKQLQFDYVENEGKAVSESEDFNLLEKQYRQVKKMSQLLYAESCVASEEWKSFQNLKEEGFDMKGLFGRVGWTSFLEKLCT